MKKLLLPLILLALLFSSPAHSSENTPPLTVVIFGATGDLTTRKLYPALFNLNRENELDKDVRIIAIGRRAWDQEEFYSSVINSLHTFSRNVPTEAEWESFKGHLVYKQMDFLNPSDYQSLANLRHERNDNILFFLATDSFYFYPIIELLGKYKLLEQTESYSRVIIEKPFGEDLDSALALQAKITQHLDEEQIYRMDHYLGKEGLFQLAKFRLQDTPYEDLLNNNYVSNVQLTLSETIGIGTRASFYENTGHLRDVVQNHAMQVLAFAMMDKPISADQEEILAEKAKALASLRALSPTDIIRGQYTAGVVKGLPALGYREERGVPEDSSVETFVQTRLFFDNERWGGVPFYIRSGKRLPEQLTQVKFIFDENPHQLDSITFVIQPNPRILINQNGTTTLFNTSINPTAHREGYENQILAAIQGDKTGFVSLEEVIYSWTLFTPTLKQWKSDPEILFYPSGTWAPKAAEEQLQEDGFEWNL